MKNQLIVYLTVLMSIVSLQAQVITSATFTDKKQTVFDIRVKYNAGCTLDQTQTTTVERNKWIGGSMLFGTTSSVGATASNVAVRNSEQLESGFNTASWSLTGDVLTITGITQGTIQGGTAWRLIFKVLPRDNPNHIVLVRQDGGGCANVHYYVSDKDNFRGYYVYYNATTKDNFTMSQQATESKVSDNSAYKFERMEGKILSRAVSGTVPLKVFYSEERKDYVTCAQATTISDVTTAGYKSVNAYGTDGIEGYIHISQVTGTVPLKLFYSDARKEHFTTSTTRGEQDALGAGYRFVRIEGYVYP